MEQSTSKTANATSQPITWEQVQQLLERLPHAPEPEQCAMLSTLGLYTATSEKGAVAIMKALEPYMHSVDGGVLVGTVAASLAVVAPYERLVAKAKKKAVAALVSCLCWAPQEIQWLCLSTLQVLATGSSQLLAAYQSAFYPRDSDVVGVKVAKLQLLAMAVCHKTASDALSELRFHTMSRTAQVAVAAVKALQQMACTIEGTAEPVYGVLLDCVRHSGAECASSSLAAMAEITKQHPSIAIEVAESVVEIATLKGSVLLTNADEDGAAGLLWLVGEYGEAWEASRDLIEQWLDAYSTFPGHTRSLLLTCSMKLYAKASPQYGRVLGAMLKKALDDSEDRLAHDRAMIYVRLLQLGLPEVRRVMLGAGLSGNSEDGL